jgi:hypothetical protein
LEEEAIILTIKLSREKNTVSLVYSSEENAATAMENLADIIKRSEEAKLELSDFFDAVAEDLAHHIRDQKAMKAFEHRIDIQTMPSGVS